MFSKETEALLHKSLPAPLALPAMVCNSSLRHDIDDLVASVLPRMKLAVIDDKNTSVAYGDEIFRALRGRFECTRIFLEGIAVADQDTVEYIRKKSSSCDALIAVGSGTISDLCKYASHLEGKPYVIFPTAASMNGYLSANASITVEGYKKTMKAHMPLALFCDMSVIAAAPARLHKSGLGDSLARQTAQADWLLSNLLLGTAYDETPFALLTPLEPHLLENARGIAKNDPATIELLMKILLLSGLGMTIAGGSYPASQGEHMIAHTYEMLEKTPLKHSFHGEQIGVTTLAMAQLQESYLRKIPVLRATAFDIREMTELFGEHSAAEAQKAYDIKRGLIKSNHAEINQNKWENIAHRLEPVMIPSRKIEAILKAAETYDSTQSLGWDNKLYQTATTHARFLRDRFTFLDLE